MSVPIFATVGHPNKGKSSIVATLAQDESVQVSLVPGTTVRSRYFPMKVDGEVQYILVDTPGFQRARQALAWMKAQAVTAAERSSAVCQFVETYYNTDKFIDECELLAPVIKGAGILYVIDGSRPYGEEYEAEMEILQWTGQPSIALINMVGEGNYIEEWRAALSQYFKIVRIFNAVTAEFHKRLELLKAFGQLREEWQAPLNKAIEILEEDRRVRCQRSALHIAEMLANMIALIITKRLSPTEDDHAYKESLTQKYKIELCNLEQKGRRTIERFYNYHALERREKDLEILDTDLFSLDSWNVFGLKKRQLLTTGAAGGALLGSGFDLAVGGTSFLLGAAVGSMIGGASAWFSYNRISDIKILGLPLGGSELRVGPAANINFPYVVLGRAIYHYLAVIRRTHAQRDILSLDKAAGAMSTYFISDHQRKKLEKIFTRIRSTDDGTFDPALVDSLAGIIGIIIADLDKVP